MQMNNNQWVCPKCGMVLTTSMDRINDSCGWVPEIYDQRIMHAPTCKPEDTIHEKLERLEDKMEKMMEKVMFIYYGTN